MNIFKLQEKNTNFLSEMLAGMTTFFIMSYLLVQCPALMTEGGISATSAYLAICFAAATGCIVAGFLSNQPFALAPSLGMTVFFTSTLVGEMHYTYTQALALTLMGGIIFLLLSLAGVQNLIYTAIPMSVKKGVSAGLGIYIALIGCKNAGMLTYSANGLWKLVDFSESSKKLFTTIVMLAGVLLTVLFKKTRIPFPVLFGIFSSGAVYYILGMERGYVSKDDLSPDLGSVNSEQLSAWASESLFKNLTNGISSLFGSVSLDIKSILTLLLVVAVCALFNSAESSSVIYATARNAGTLDDGGNFGELKKTMFANSISSLASSCMGAPMVTVSAESGAGVSVGGKTGLAAVTTGLFFLMAALFTPVADIIPPVVTACAMVLLGISMAGAAKDIDFGEWSESIPAFLTIMMIVFTSSIIDGIAVGILAHIAVLIASFKFTSLKIMELLLCVLFFAAYFMV